MEMMKVMIIIIMTLNNVNFPCKYWVILNAFFNCLSISLRKTLFFSKNFSGMQSEHQTVWILIRLHILLGLIWVQNVCKTEDIMNRAKCYNFN